MSDQQQNDQQQNKPADLNLDDELLSDQELTEVAGGVDSNTGQSLQADRAQPTADNSNILEPEPTFPNPPTNLI